MSTDLFFEGSQFVCGVLEMKTGLHGRDERYVCIYLFRWSFFFIVALDIYFILHFSVLPFVSSKWNQKQKKPLKGTHIFVRSFCFV